jgi:DNA gyrase subunit A
MLVTVSHAGYIKRSAIGLYRSQHRGGKGLTGLSMKDLDFAEHIFTASTHDYILFFTNQGKVHWRKVHQMPQMGRAARGKNIINLLNLERDESVTAFMPVRDFTESHYIVMATKKGVVKKTDLKAYSNPRSGGIIALTLDEGDELISTVRTDGSRHLLLTSRLGQGIRFRETDARPMGRVTRGVRGINLAKNDEVVGMEVVNDSAYLLTVTERGFGKRTSMKDFNPIGRGGKGVRAVKITEKVGRLVGTLQVGSEEQIMVITDAGRLIRISVEGISVYGRASQGVKLIDITEKDENVVSIALIQEAEG